MATPYATHHLASTASTQDEARSRYDGRPLLVTADRQTAGRGRRGRSWQSAPRAVAASVATALAWPPQSWPRLTLVAGLVAATTVDTSLDWPNDLVIGPNKVGGLLTEVADGVAVFGLGLNLWWPGAPAGMAAIYESDPGELAAPRVAAAFVSGLLERIGAGPREWGRGDYLERCVTIGETVVWEGGSGTAVDVAPDGALVVETATGSVHLHSSDVERIRRSTVPPMRPL